MRTLKFIVEDQLITKDPSCDFSGLIPGTAEYLQLEFSFSSVWTGSKKVVSFWSILGREYTPQVLKDDNTCIVPAEALKRKSFKVGVIGKKNSLRLTTNKIVITQDGGKK